MSDILHDNLLLPSPLQPIKLADNLSVLVKRDDLIHPVISGNKWRKLKYNLDYILSNGLDHVITFGGPFSNHIHALAGACQLLRIRCTAIIRGEIDLHNPTLRFCRHAGMELISVSRSAYRLKEEDPGIKEILKSYHPACIIPEGGANELAMRGVAEITDELEDTLGDAPDYIVLSAGTGCTAAGLLLSDTLKSKVIVIPALKSNHLYSEILSMSKHKNKDLLFVNTDYHFGGYAKWNENLVKFITEFESSTAIPLDQVYNGKAMYGLCDLISRKYFEDGARIVYLHTGGLQGKAGMEYRNTKINS